MRQSVGSLETEPGAANYNFLLAADWTKDHRPSVGRSGRPVVASGRPVELQNGLAVCPQAGTRCVRPGPNRHKSLTFFYEGAYVIAIIAGTTSKVVGRKSELASSVIRHNLSLIIGLTSACRKANK